MSDRKPGDLKICYVITKNAEGRSFWNRIGVAFVNRDGSLNVKLNAFPVDGKMQIRDYVPAAGQEYPDDYEVPAGAGEFDF